MRSFLLGSAPHLVTVSVALSLHCFQFFCRDLVAGAFLSVAVQIKNRDISRRKQVLTLVTPVQGSQVSSPISTVRNLDRNRFRTEFVSPGPSNTFEFFQLLEPTFLVS